MKRLLFLALYAFSTLGIFAQGDEQKAITVIVNSNTPSTVRFETCEVSVSAIRSGSSDVNLSIEVMNDGDYGFFLFGKEFTVKELKKEKPSIIFDKKSYGTTSKDIVICDGVKERWLLIPKNGNRILTFTKRNEKIVKCELPLYLVTAKNRKKYSIRSHVKIILNVRLIMNEPDQSVFEEFKQRYDTLVKEFSHVEICGNSKHQPSLEEQKRPYLEKKNRILGDIETLKEKNGWKEWDEAYRPFRDLKNQLDTLELTIKDCEQCLAVPGPSHSCTYCSWTADEVLQKLNSYYKKMDQNRMTKDQAKKEAEKIHRAFSSSCPNLKKKVNGSTEKIRIKKCYDKINNY